MKMYKALSMSKSRSDAKEHIEDLALTTALHITHLFFFNSTENSKHWKNEVSSYLQKCWGYRNIKGGKKLSISDMSDFLYTTSWESKDIDGFFNLSVVDHNKDTIPSLSLKEAKKLKILKRIELLYIALVNLICSKSFSRFLSEQIIQEHLDDWWEYVERYERESNKPI